MTDEKKLAIQHALVHYDGNGSIPYCDLVYEGLKALLVIDKLCSDNRILNELVTRENFRIGWERERTAIAKEETF